MSDWLVAPGPWRASVAPMLDWTDRHCRFFHRLLSRQTRLYTEMVTTGALLHGDVGRHLDFDPAEHPLALQLGGSEPQDLARCAKLASQWGYDEINLNVGCPSDRVQRGAFGACLMREPVLVGDCLAAMQEAADLPVTVKHRIGLDQDESYSQVRDFVGMVHERSQCQVFIVHARNAWLKGLSPKENREVPPLRYEVVRRLKADFPHLTMVLNGGLRDAAQIEPLLQPSPTEGPAVDGVMVGREAYHNPWVMSDWDQTLWGCSKPSDSHERSRQDVEEAMVAYMSAQLARPDGPKSHTTMSRHMLGLYHGMPGARHWRQVWSDHRLKFLPPEAVMAKAHQRA